MIPRDRTEQKVIESIEGLLSLPTESLNVDTRRSDIPEWDSIRQLEVMLELEKQFSVQFTASEITENREIKQILELILKKTSKNS